MPLRILETWSQEDETGREQKFPNGEDSHCLFRFYVTIFIETEISHAYAKYMNNELANKN